MSGDQEITFVTAYVDLNKYEQRENANERNREKYFEWADFLFKLDKNIIFYVETEKDQFEILENRREYNLLHKTLVVRKDITDIPYYNQRYEIHDMLTNYFPENGSSKETGLYCIFTLSKIYFMEQSIKLNFFNTNYFAWIDFGLSHLLYDRIPKNINEYLTPVTEKIRMMERFWTTKEECSNIKYFGKIIRCKVAGGFWIGSVGYLKQFISLFKKYLHMSLSEEVVLNDEGVSALVYYHHPELFDNYIGEYYSILCNYRNIIKYDPVMLDNLKLCVDTQEYEHGLYIGKILYNMFNQLDFGEKCEVYDYLIICSYYQDKTESQQYLESFLNFVEDKKNFEYLKQNADRIFENLIFYDNKEKYISWIKKLIN